MKKVISAILILFTLVSFGCKTKDNEKQTQVPTKVTIAQFGHVFLYLPLYVAQDKGYFKEEGLDVKLVSTGGDEKTFAAVASGSAQFGVADPTFTAIAKEKGQGGKVIASIVNGVPFWGVTFKKGMKTKDKPEELAGLRIAAYTAPSTNYTVMKKILQNNGNPVEAKIVEGAFGSLVAMLNADKADIAMELEPVASIAVAEGAQVVYSMAKAFGDFALTGLTTTDDYIKNHSATVQSTVNALAKAIKYIQSDFEGALTIAKKEFPEVNDSILRNALKRIIDESSVPKTVVMSKESWDKAISLRREVGDIKGGGTYEENVDMSFARKVK